MEKISKFSSSLFSCIFLTMEIFVVVLSGFFHALWNVIAKKSRSKMAFLLNVQCLSALAFFPYVATHLSLIQWSWPSTCLIGISMLLHGIYFVLLSRAYSVGDLSRVYPIIRGSASLLVPLVAVTVLHEHLTLMGWCGVGGIVVGISLINESSWSTKGWKKILHPHTFAALLVGISSATCILIDKQAIRYCPIMTLNWIGTMGNIGMLLFFIRRSATIRREWKKNSKWIFLGAILAPLSYLMFLWAIQTHQVAQLAPIREIGTVFGIALGIFLLKERKGKQRLLASICITTGIVLLSLNL